MMRFRREKKRTVPSLNTTSTADMSFMLLILFLVASSMDLDKGISRQLPPMDKTQKQATAIDGKKLMRITIDDDSKVQLEGKAIAVETLHQRVQQFIEANGKAHMIQLQTSRKASYDVYVQVQNQLVEAITPFAMHVRRSYLERNLSFVVMSNKPKSWMRYR